MKPLFFLGFALLTFTCLAEAHLFAPPGLDTLADAETAYLTRVISVEAGTNGFPSSKIHFTITEVLRGQPRAPLTLTPYDDEFKPGSEWILIHHNGGFKDCVGWAMKGDCEWLPIRITRNGDKAIAQWLGPLDQVRDYLKQHPNKAASP